MRLRRTAMLLAIAAAAVWMGCAPPDDATGPAGDPPGAQADGPATAPVPPAPPAPQDMEREVAGRGVGREREELGQGFYTTPINVLLGVRERLAYDAQIPNQMKIYKAMHDGKPPQDLEEFMREIVEPCGIELPELKRGHRYVYDAEAGQLMVERPR